MVAKALLRQIESDRRRRLGVAVRLRFKLAMQDLLIDSPQAGAWPDLMARLGGPETIAALAHQHKAFLRARGVKSPQDLLRLILAYAPGNRSLRLTAAEAAAVGIADVSDVALLDRFRRCADWLTALCEGLLARAFPSTNDGFASSVRLVDGSRIEGPGKTGARLHLCYDAGRQRIADFVVTPLSEGEKLDRVTIRPGEVYLGDRGYPQPQALANTREAIDLYVQDLTESGEPIPVSEQ